MLIKEQEALQQLLQHVQHVPLERGALSSDYWTVLCIKQQNPDSLVRGTALRSPAQAAGGCGGLDFAGFECVVPGAAVMACY